MDPITLLKRQHREVEGLFRQIEDAEDAGSRRQLLDRIVEKLTLHTSIEEELFYPAVREAPAKSAQDTIDEAFEEHHVVKLVMADLPKADVDDGRFSAKMTVFSELIKHHVQEEEKEMFKLARKLGKDELSSLGEQMTARVAEAGGLEEEEEEEAEESASHRRRRRTA